MAGGNTIPVDASGGASIWEMWQKSPKDHKVGWEQFQKDFRNANPQVAADGYLNKGDRYNVPVYTPPAAPAQQGSQGSDNGEPPVTTDPAPPVSSGPPTTAP